MPLIKKIITSNKQRFVSLVNFDCQYAHRQSLNRHWLVSFAASDSASTLFVNFWLGREGIKDVERGCGRCDFSREAIIFIISIKGRWLIKGRQLFEEVRYAIFPETILLRMHINVQLTEALEISEALDSISKAC